MINALGKMTIFIHEGACPCPIVGAAEPFFNAKLGIRGRVEDMIGNMMVITLSVVDYGTLCHKSLQARACEGVVSILKWRMVGLLNTEIGVFYFGYRCGMMTDHLLG